MAKARQCDICGRYFDYTISKISGRKSIHVMKIGHTDMNDNYNTEKSYDVCPGCANEIKKLIETLGRDQKEE